MKCCDSKAASPISRISHLFALALCAVLSFSSFALGGQNPPPQKKKTPTMTTDDVVRPKAEQTVEEGEVKSEKAASEKSEGAVTPQAGKAKDDPEEEAWRERVRLTRQRAKEAEAAAEETELRITELRNNLNASGGTAQGRNAVAAELDETGKKLLELRAEARAAKADLEKLLEHGREKGFAEAAGPKQADDEGRPNEDYYRSRYQKLNEELRTAQRRAELYENRVRELNQRIRNNSGTGDNFYIAQLTQDRDEAQKSLEEAREARDKAQQDISALLEEARRAGVPPGVFRN
jgi:hypothetical protein